MRFEATQPEVEFQTGHALWALQAAGVPVDSPQVAKAIEYLTRVAEKYPVDLSAELHRKETEINRPESAI